jgi:hypothetical protein
MSIENRNPTANLDTLENIIGRVVMICADNFDFHSTAHTLFKDKKVRAGRTIDITTKNGLIRIIPCYNHYSYEEILNELKTKKTLGYILGNKVVRDSLLSSNAESAITESRLKQLT